MYSVKNFNIVRKIIFSEEEKLLLYEFFEKSLMEWPEYSVNLIASCKECQTWFIKDIIVKMTYEKHLFLQETPKNQNLHGVLFAKESCDEIRNIFWEQGICFNILFELHPSVLELFFKKYPQYKRPVM